MRATRAASLVLVLAAAGALIGHRLAAPVGGGNDAPTARASVPAAGPDSPASPGATTTTNPSVVPSTGSTTLRMEVRAADGRAILTTAVGAFDPVRAGDGYRPIDPPSWDRAVWVRYRPLVPPTDTADGTSYVYGHACRHHSCSFTELFRAAPGGSVTIDADGRRVEYRITSVSAAYPKTGPGSLAELRGGVADRSVARRLVLITCGYDGGDVSRTNVVVVAVMR